MRSILIAFVLGVALTTTVFFLVDSPSESPILADQGEEQTPEISAAGTSKPTPDPAPETEETPATSEPEIENGSLATKSITNEVVPLSVPIRISTPPTPFLVMPDGRGIQTGAGVSEIHSKLEFEPIDYGWAPIAESDLFNFFAQSTALTAYFPVPSIQCRSTMCLIQAASDDPQARGIWRQEMLKLSEQPWGTQFAEYPIAVANYLTPEGQMAHLWYLKKQDAGDAQLRSAAP